MTVVYIDSVFLLNGLMDYLLLTATARLSGTVLRRRRYLLAAVLGGIYAAAVFLPGGAFLATVPVKVAAAVLMGLLAFGREPKLLRRLLLFLVVSCGMAGAVLVLGLLSGGTVPMVQGVFYTDVSPKVLLIASTAAYLVLSVAFRASAANGISGELLPVSLCIQGRVIELTALRDTGNGLRDPVGNRPVLVVSAGETKRLFRKETAEYLPPAGWKNPVELVELLSGLEPDLHPRLLPYCSVGTNSCLMAAVTADWAEIGGRKTEKLPVGLSPTRLGDGYGALWGGDWKGAENERTAGNLAQIAALGGTASGGGHPLHWRKRYSSSTAGKEPGSGIAGQAGSGGCKGGTDRT